MNIDINIDLEKINMRPIIATLTTNETISEEEFFQNNTLRPIIKMQHDLLILACKAELKALKNVFYNLTKEERQNYLDTLFSKNISFRSEVKGLIIGHFTVDEYHYYTSNSSTISKRIIQIVKERVKSLDL
jgi:hypothetical protein